MDIRTKIFLGFSVMLVLILSMCVMSIEYLMNIRHDSRVAAAHTEIMGLSYEIEIALLEARRAEKNYLQTGYKPDLDNFRKQTSKIKTGIGRIKEIDAERDFTGHMEKVEELVAAYESGLLTDSGKNPGGKENSNLNSAILQERLYPVMEKAKKQQERAMGWSDVTISQAIMAIVLLGIAAILAGAVMTYYIPKQVTKSTGLLLDAMKKIQAGDNQVRAGIKSGDEMEIMGEYFDRMLDTLEETKRKVSNAEKLVALGTLSAGVAHEINNPLTGILTSAYIALKDLPAGHKSREDLEIIIRETIRCRDIVKGLLDFSREAKSEKMPVDVNSVIEQALMLVKNQEAYREIKIIRNLSRALPKVNANSNRLEQVFLNVIINAQEAMSGRGELEVSSVSADGGVEISFRDTGRGISQENLHRVCDPFFTTKEAGRGTGLGLAVSYGIIKEYNGSIELKSRENYGTTVTIRLNAEMEKGAAQHA